MQGASNVNDTDAAETRGRFWADAGRGDTRADFRRGGLSHSRIRRFWAGSNRHAIVILIKFYLIESSGIGRY